MSASATNPDNRSPAEIEREVEQTRASVENTLEELRERASPNRLFDEAVDWLRSSGGAAFTQNLGRTVRDNPMPIMLIGAGIAWLALSGRNGGGRPYAATTHRYDFDDAADMDDGLGAASGPGRYGYATTGEAARPGGAGMRVHGTSTGGSGPSVMDTARSAADTAGRSASAALAAAREGASSTYESARDGTRSAYDAVREGVQSASQGAADAARAAGAAVGDAASGTARRLRRAAGAISEPFDTDFDVGERIGRMAEERPLLLGALGFALGAAVGALLPSTRTEDRLLGEARDDLADRASALAADTLHQVKETAQERLDEAGVGARGEGIGGAVAEAARQAREAVRDSAGSVAERAKEAMRPADDAKPAADPGRAEARPESGTAHPGRPVAASPAPASPAPAAPPRSP